MSVSYNRHQNHFNFDFHFHKRIHSAYKMSFVTFHQSVLPVVPQALLARVLPNTNEARLVIANEISHQHQLAIS